MADTTFIPHVTVVASEFMQEVNDHVHRYKHAEFTDDELSYWVDKAAMLDPDAYRYYNTDDDGAGWSVTVPAGETWYLLNAWHIVDASSSDFEFLRLCDANRAVPLPSGTVLKAASGQWAYAYVCKPALVYSDTRYNNPKALYYERINRLRSLVSYKQYVNVPAGSTIDTNITTSFPTDFTNGLIMSASAMDVSWVTIGNGMNLHYEISDRHQIRFAEAIMVPFKRTVFTVLRTNPATVSGGVETTMEGHASVRYFKLPTDW